jgi:hypothetical protein
VIAEVSIENYTVEVLVSTPDTSEAVDGGATELVRS